MAEPIDAFVIQKNRKYWSKYELSSVMVRHHRLRPNPTNLQVENYR